MTGQQGEYQFSLYIRDQKLHYEAFRNGLVLLMVSTFNLVSGHTFQISRGFGNFEITSNLRKRFASVPNITIGDFDSIRFTKICVGGGSINNPIYMDSLQSVYYNLHYLSGKGSDFNERNVPTKSYEGKLY